MSQNQPTSNQQNMIQMIQPAQATRLLEALKEELAKAKASSADPTKARQHYARAEQIKQVLVNYRQQQQQRAVSARVNNSTSDPNAQGPSGMRPNTNMGMSGNTPGQTSQAAFNTNRPATANPASGAGMVVNPGGPIGIPNPGGNGSQPIRQGLQPVTQGPNQGADVSGQQNPSSVTPGVTTEKYNQVRTRLQDLERKIRTLEAGKRPDMNQEETIQIDNQLRELRLKYGQYSKFAVYMKNQLIESARTAGTVPGMSSNPATKPVTPSVPPSAPLNNTAGSPNQSIQTPAVTNASLAATNANAVHDGSQAGNIPVPGSGTPNNSASRAQSPSLKDPVMTGMNLNQITKTSVPSIPISSTINVKPQTPITLKPGANNVRPTITAGGSSGLGQVINSPAIVRMPTFDMATSGPLQDNGGRVLTKRKLTELVNTIGADEGDGKTTIDGDVEELLLDLADEFVSSVTTFACRLAKHRKTDSVDVRDVQLHLERNWNIRIPGHAMDEIRSTRKWQPSSSYNQKVSGVEIVKAVNGNIN